MLVDFQGINRDEYIAVSPVIRSADEDVEA
jgi:hypothetical protein